MQWISWTHTWTTSTSSALRLSAFLKMKSAQQYWIGPIVCSMIKFRLGWTCETNFFYCDHLIFSLLCSNKIWGYPSTAHTNMIETSHRWRQGQGIGLPVASLTSFSSLGRSSKLKKQNATKSNTSTPTNQHFNNWLISCPFYVRGWNTFTSI